MSKELIQFDSECLSYEIASYIDGELSREHEEILEAHLATCESCANELTIQKQFLNALDNGVRSAAEIELPKDFARKLIATAESNVSGLRDPREQLNALFVVVTLGLFALFAHGAESSGLFSGVSQYFEQAASVGGILVRIVFSFFVGLAVILRNVGSTLESNISMAILPVLLSVPILFVVSRLLDHLRRA